MSLKTSGSESHQRVILATTVLWIILNLIVCYQCRYWINNDTIGSLDSARHLRAFNLLGAVNASWGVGFAFFLAFLPLGEITSSWLLVHLLAMFLLLLSQFFIYRSLRRLGIPALIATALSIIWGSSNYATGSMFFMTADIALCLLGSVYLFLAVRTRLTDQPINFCKVFLLGTLHGLAGITKTIAFPGLLLFPLSVIIVTILTDSKRDFTLRLVLRRGGRFAVSYFAPLVLLISAWGIACWLKYGRFTLGESTAYTHAMFVQQSQQIQVAKEIARHRLPGWGTYWWSDFGLSMQQVQSYGIHFNFSDQIDQVIHNLLSVLPGGQNFRMGAPLLAVFVLVFVSWFLRRLYFDSFPALIWILSLTSFLTLFLYLNSLFYARYYPFAVLFSIPLCGFVLSWLWSRFEKVPRMLLVLFLSIAVAHGVASMIYGAIFHAPTGQHFEVAEVVREECTGPLGAYFDSERRSPYHHGFIAYLADKRTAEILPTENDDSKYEASFMPGCLLLVTSPRSVTSQSISVGSRHFAEAGFWIWRDGILGRSDKMLLYLPVER